MSILTRSDGTQFIIQAYRERITERKKSTLYQTVHGLAEQHGQFVRLYKKASGSYETIFAREPGYLLGESIKQYFYQSPQLIFCEEMCESKQILVVVIRDNAVYLDTLVSPDALRQELMPLMADKIPFQVVTSGNVPLKPLHADKGPFEFSLEQDMCQSFEQLHEPLLSRLPTVGTLQLLPLSLALKAERLHKRPLRPYVITSIFVFLILCTWFFSRPMNKPVPLANNTSPLYDPWQAYDAALTSPSPTDKINELTRVIITLYELPGWSAAHIHFNNGHYKIKLKSDGGNFEQLLLWVREHRFQFRIENNTVYLFANSNLAKRHLPKQIYPLPKITTAALDRLDIALGGKKTHVSNVQIEGESKAVDLTIQIDDASINTLTALANNLKDLPVALKDVDLDENTGSLNGNVKLSLWGQ